jgi:hypothetical protein
MGSQGLNDIGTIFFQDGYRLARQFLNGGVNRQAILNLMASAYESIDGLIQSFRRRCRVEGLKVDCRKECTYCCSQAVLASGHEVLAIWLYMHGNLDQGLMDEIREGSASKHRDTDEMQAMEFLHYIQPCPFLKNKACLVYPVRPMACRCYLSSSLKSCRDQYDQPRSGRRAAALYDFPLKAGRGMNEGIRSGLMESGLLPSEWLLECFIYRLFESEERLDEWLEGKPAFGIRSLSPEENRYMREF